MQALIAIVPVCPLSIVRDAADVCALVAASLALQNIKRVCDPILLLFGGGICDPGNVCDHWALSTLTLCDQLAVWGWLINYFSSC